MKVSPIAKYFERRREALVNLGEAVVHPHRGTAGAEREALIRAFLVDHIPPMVSIGTGLVFGHRWARGLADDISRQQDIILYRHDLPSLVLGGSPLYFVESVVAALEVKTNYVASELDEVFECARSVKSIQCVPTRTLQMGTAGATDRNTPRRVLHGVIYFHGPNVRTPLVERLNELALHKRNATPDSHFPDFFFSAEAGLIVRGAEVNVLFDDNVDVASRDSVHRGLSESECEAGAYRRVFDDSAKWRGLQAIILEIAERTQRYAISYADISGYV